MFIAVHCKTFSSAVSNHLLCSVFTVCIKLKLSNMKNRIYRGVEYIIILATLGLLFNKTKNIITQIVEINVPEGNFRA